MIRITTATLMAMLGGLTGLVSALVPDTLPNALQPVSLLFLLGGSSVHPGLFFGLVIGLGVWRTGERRRWVIGLTFLITVFAWSAAMNTAFWVYEIKDVRSLFGDTADRSSFGGATTTVKLLTGFLAGIAGAGVLVIGCASVVPTLRGATPVGLTILIGGFTGLLLYPFLAGWNETVSLLLLLAVWQASVGACLGRWLFVREPAPGTVTI